MVGTLREVSAARPSADLSALAGRDIAEFNATLTEVYKRAGTAGAIFTLHFDSFADELLNKHYMVALRQTPARMLTLVTPRLISIGTAQPQHMVEARVQQLQRLFRRVIVEARSANDVSLIAPLRPAMIATPWTSIAGSSNPEAVASEIHARTKDSALLSMITGVDCGTSFAAAAAAGFDVVAGGRIGCFESPLSEHYPLSRAQIADGD